jgi:hypothetical protein
MVAEAHYEALLDGLEKILQAAPAPPRRKQGRPSPWDLDEVVHILVQEWERMTGAPFTQAWHRDQSLGGRRVPNSDGARFVYKIVEFIDSTRLDELPNVTEKIVTERLKKAEAAAGHATSVK